MKIIVKSNPAFFEKEKDGRKNNTIRTLDGFDTITVINAETKEEFQRTISDISFFEGRIIISWENITREARHKQLHSGSEKEKGGADCKEHVISNLQRIMSIPSPSQEPRKTIRMRCKNERQ